MLKVADSDGLLDLCKLPGERLTLLGIGYLDERHLFIEPNAA